MLNLYIYILVFILFTIFGFLCGSYYAYKKIEEEDRKWEWSENSHLHILEKGKK